MTSAKLRAGQNVEAASEVFSFFSILLYILQNKLSKILQLAHFLCCRFLFPIALKISVMKKTFLQLHLAIKTVLDCKMLYHFRYDLQQVGEVLSHCSRTRVSGYSS